MLVDNDVYINKYVADGSTASFPIAFPFLEASHIEVYTRGEDGEDVLVDPSMYTITGAGVEAGGELTFNTPPATGTVIAIIRNVPITQLYAYTELDNFPAESHENALAKLTMIDQQQAEILGRAVIMPVTSNKTPDEYMAEFKSNMDAAVDTAQSAAEDAAESRDEAANILVQCQEIADSIVVTFNNQMATVVMTTAIDVPSGTTITLPEDGDKQVQYEVGSHALQVFYNGAAMFPGSQYEEVGTAGEASDEVKLLQELRAGDELMFHVFGLDAASLVDGETITWDPDTGLSVNIEDLGDYIAPAVRGQVEEDVAALLDDEYQKVNTQVWNSLLEYEKGALVTGSDGQLYVALKDSLDVDPVNDESGTWARVTTHGDPYITYKGILDKFRIAARYSPSSSAPGTQGFTIDTKRHKFIVGCKNSGDTYQELLVLDPSPLKDASRFWDNTKKWVNTDVWDLTTLAVDATHTFSTLGHVNSLCYLPDTDEIYVMPLTRDGSNNIVVKVLDASDYSVKSDLSVVPAANVGQFALSYDAVRNRFVMGMPCTIDSSGSVVSSPTYIFNNVVQNMQVLYNALWIRICARDLSTIEEFTVRAPDGLVFGTGNGACCRDGIFIMSTFNSVSVFDLDKRAIVTFDETQVDNIEPEDFDFDEEGNLFCHVGGAVIAQYSDVTNHRNSLGALNKKYAFYHPSNARSLDLNDIQSPGSYLINVQPNPTDTNMTPTTLSNAPGGAINGLLCVERGGNIIKQFWSRWGTVNSNDYETSVRTKIGDTWSNWRRFIVDTELFYQKGETEDKNYGGPALGIYGWITAGTKDMYLYMPMDKFIPDGVTITLKKFIGTCRGPNEYIESSEHTYVDLTVDPAINPYSITVTKANRTTMRIKITKSSAWSNASNNKPIVMAVNRAIFAFS